jgi:hypothetical protein
LPFQVIYEVVEAVTDRDGRGAANAAARKLATMER